MIQDWTHPKTQILDIRKLHNLYALKIKETEDQDDEIGSLLINHSIFEERVTSYFLKPMSQISRNDILNVKWDLYITKGYFIKLNTNEVGSEWFKQIDQDPDKYYVSFLDVSGKLSDFKAIINKNK